MTTHIDPRVLVVRVKGPDKDRWSKGTGAQYDVYWAGDAPGANQTNGLIGSVSSTRLSTPAPRGSRLRPGTSYTAWGATPKYGAGTTSGRTQWRDTRKQAIATLIDAFERDRKA